MMWSRSQADFRFAEWVPSEWMILWLMPNWLVPPLHYISFPTVCFSAICGLRNLFQSMIAWSGDAVTVVVQMVYHATDRLSSSSSLSWSIDQGFDLINHSMCTVHSCAVCEVFFGRSLLHWRFHCIKSIHPSIHRASKSQWFKQFANHLNTRSSLVDCCWAINDVLSRR